jgi:hypothetical protein
LSDNKNDRLLHVIGRDGYKTPLIANPKDSRLARTILAQYHDQHHLSSPATIQALVFKDFYFVGGSAAYLKKLESKCPRCKLLRARPSEALAGPAPEGTQGPLPTDGSIWRRWMLDICGPVMLVPWAGKRALRGTRITLKHWILLSVDLCSQQIDAQKIKIQEELKRSFEANGVTVHLSIPYSPHRQGRVEAAVKRLKTQLTELCYNESQTKLTPLEVTSLLSAACNNLNNRPLLLTAESSMEEKRILCPSYLSCADLNLQHISCAQDPTTHRVFSMHDSALTRRAAMVQERLETFKSMFDLFMKKSMASLGKFNRELNKIDVGDVVLILDKKKETLPVQSKSRYVLGVVEEAISERSVRIRYITPGKSCGKCKTMCSHDKSHVERCERSTQGLCLIIKACDNIKFDEDAMPCGNDVVIDPLFPAGELVQLEIPPANITTIPPKEIDELDHQGDTTVTVNAASEIETVRRPWDGPTDGLRRSKRLARMVQDDQ